MILRNCRVLRNPIIALPYRKPDVHFSTEGEALVEFYTADTPGNYRIVGEGVTGSGKIITFNREITIERSVR